MQELLIATKNPGKYREIMEVIGDLPFEFLFLKDLGIDDSDFEEDGDSFEENALKKAQYFFDKTGFLTLAEDSGILVEALSGELGVKTRRWGAGEKASDKEWIEYFLRRMENMENRAAKFVCATQIVGEGIEASFQGESSGVISVALEAEILQGIPLSSCFKPDGFEKVYAALTVEEKNRISHRGRAMEQVKNFLKLNA